MTHPYMIDQSG